MSNHPDPDPLAAVGEILRRYRLQAGLSQGQVGQLADVEKSTLCRIEQGKRLNIATMVRLSEVLDIDIAELAAPFRTVPQAAARKRRRPLQQVAS